jgi:hypothetical protein
LFEVVVGSLLSVLLGVVLAATILILKPVEVVKELPKEPVAGKLYYLEGKKDWNAGRKWMFKRDAFLQGHSVSVTEDELNTWVDNIYPSATPPPSGKKDKKEEAAAAANKPLISTGTPNFRLMGETLKCCVVYEVNVFGYSFNVAAQAEGAFAKPKGKDTIEFRPDVFYVGSLPAHKLLVLKALIFKQVVGCFELPGDLVGIWAKLGDVKIEKKQLVFTLPEPS